MRYVIAVSRLIPHGASLVPRDDSSQVFTKLFLSAFYFSAVESDLGCWESH